MLDSDINPLVSPEWLIRNLNSGFVIVDCRWDLVDHEKGTREFHEGHIPGAQFVSMEGDLADLTVMNRGRHPMPDADKFTGVAERIGISDSSTVICYDTDCSGSARMWFLLKFYGHDAVYILDGGIDAYRKAGGEITGEISETARGSFHPSIRHDMIAQTQEIRKGGLNMVDSRAPERYRGEIEPIDPKKGHIPGASNFPYPIYTENGKFKDKQYLKRVMGSIGENPVFYCGSGVTSCVPYVASVIAGVRARIYPGSWSEWISYDENEVVQGDSRN